MMVNMGESVRTVLFRLLAAVDIDTTQLPNNAGADPADVSLPILLNIIFATLGSVALLIFVINGFRYVLSNGDPAKMSQAKNGIIYALVGVAVVLAAFSIVTLVLKELR